MPLSPKQKGILNLFNDSKDDTITKKQVVAELGHEYYRNGAFHLGNILSRMVNARLLIRIKPGLFKKGNGTKNKRANESNQNQYKLF